MEKELDYWKAETIAFLALQTINEVNFENLYKVASQNISFKELLKFESIQGFENILNLTLDDALKESEESWVQFKRVLWNKGIELARLYSKKNIRIIFFNQDYYPQQLKEISEPPMWLFVEGNYQVLQNASVAIVGSRNATNDGLWLTKYIVATIAELGYSSISGLADGIDQQAHKESIRYDIPTIAVLGTGIDNNYPQGSEKLRKEIVSRGGAVVSEYLINQSYSANNFVRRNRIQAGLAQIVIPTEWKIKSGTAHTVNFAKTYQRYLVMPYMFHVNYDTPEAYSVKTYKHGRLFMLPSQHNQIVEFFKNPNQSQQQSCTEQFSIDI